MTTVDSEYVLRLADGASWGFSGIGEAGPWVEEFASALGISGDPGIAQSRITFVQIPCGPDEPVHASLKLAFGRYSLPSSKRSVVVGYPGFIPGSRREVREIILGLRSARGRWHRVDQMRRSLLPVYRQAVLSGGLPFHATLLERGGKGVLLAGPSGAGKSTCCRRVPGDWRALADDLALGVSCGEGVFRVHPLPTWSAFEQGQENNFCEAGRSVPLEALFFLQQGETDERFPLAESQAAIGMSASAVEVFKAASIAYPSYEHPDIRKAIYHNAAALSHRIPAYILRVSLTGRFWEKIEEVLEKWDSPLLQCNARGLKSA
jgi:SynChlorMet cassette protein ScmC